MNLQPTITRVTCYDKNREIVQLLSPDGRIICKTVTVNCARDFNKLVVKLTRSTVTVNCVVRLPWISIKNVRDGEYVFLVLF